MCNFLNEERGYVRGYEAALWSVAPTIDVIPVDLPIDAMPVVILDGIAAMRGTSGSSGYMYRYISYAFFLHVA